MVSSVLQPSFAHGFARSAGESDNPGLWDGLVGAWIPAFGNTGNKLFDLSGRNHNGSLTNMEPGDWVGSPDGLVLDLDGTNEDVDLGSGSILEPGLGSFSYTCVFSTTATASFPIINRINMSTSGYEILNAPTGIGSFSARIRDDATSVTTAVYSGETVENLVIATVVINRRIDKLQLYVGGLFRTESIGGLPPNAITSTQNLKLGNRNNSLYYDGKIGTVYLHNRVLFAGEIAQLHANPLAPFQLSSVPVGFIATISSIIRSIMTAVGFGFIIRENPYN